MKVSKLLYSLIVFVAITVFVLAGGSRPVKAEEGLYFEKSKYTLYEGNEGVFNIVYNDIEAFQETDEYQNEWYSTFVSSDENIVKVDWRGKYTCVGTGTAVITVYYREQKAECTVKVKAGKLKISENEVYLYSNQSIDVRISGVKSIFEYDYEISQVCCDGDYSWANFPTVTSNGKGYYTIKTGKNGDYNIRLICEKKNGVRYSKSILVHTIPVGPKETDLYVALGCTNEAEMIDSEILSVDLVKWYLGNYEFYPEDGSEYCPIKANNMGEFYAEPDTWSVSAIYNITYETEDGTVLSDEIIVSAYDPEYIPFNNYLWIGKTYEPNFTDRRYYSKVSITTSDPEIAYVNDEGKIVPMKGGKVTLYITIDGKSFSEEVEVIDVRVNESNLLTWPGCSFSFKVSGVPEGLSVTYTSSNTDVATISKKGKLKTLSNGFSLITIKIGDEEFHFTVNVGNEIPVQAVIAADEVVGKATYSQSKRMEEGYYDCSSLVWRSYAKAGLKIKNQDYAPTAADLAQYLDDNGYTISYEALPVEELLPGDIIFTSSGYNNGRYKYIDHVEMYYSTNVYYYDTYWYDNYYVEFGDVYGTIIHAGQGGGGVYISSYPGYSNIVLIARIEDEG